MKLNLTIPHISEQERIAKELDALKLQLDNATSKVEKEQLTLLLSDRLAFYFDKNLQLEASE